MGILKASLAFVVVLCGPALPAHAQGPAEETMEFFRKFVSDDAALNCNKTDDVGDYKGISKICELSLTRDSRVTITTREVNQKLSFVTVNGVLSHSEKTADALGALFLFYRFRTGDRETTAREDIAFAVQMTRMTLRELEAEKSFNIPLEGGKLAASLHHDSIHASIRFSYP